MTRPASDSTLSRVLCFAHARLPLLSSVSMTIPPPLRSFPGDGLDMFLSSRPRIKLRQLNARACKEVGDASVLLTEDHGHGPVCFFPSRASFGGGRRRRANGRVWSSFRRSSYLSQLVKTRYTRSLRPRWVKKSS